MIYSKIKNDIKVAMRVKDKNLKDVLKQVQTKVQTVTKEQGIEVNDDVVIDCINKELKQLNQTLDAISGKKDSALYVSTVEKIEILKGYLPEQMSEEDLLNELRALQQANPDVTGGKFVGLAMKTLKGKADNKAIKEAVDKLQG